MPNKKADFIGLAMGPPSERKAFVSAASPTRLRDLDLELAELIESLQQGLEGCKELQLEIRAAIDANTKVERAAARRQQARKKGPSLRDFLMARSANEAERQFKDLVLCTKSGATVRLESLGFDDNTNVTALSAARALFQRGQTPKADWRLHYVDETGRESGFGWERNFLDEVFVVLMDE